MKRYEILARTSLAIVTFGAFLCVYKVLKW